MCLHESGHAVVAQAAGCEVRKVTAEELEDDVKIGFTDYEPPINITLHEQLWTDVGVLYGGKAAESIMGGRESSKGILKDEQDIQKALSKLHALSSFNEQEQLARCEKLAREIIGAHKGTLRRLSWHLSKRRVVQGRELHKILQGIREGAHE